MSFNKTRGLLYRIAKFLGDLQAISSGSPGKMTRRVGRRAAGKVTGRAIGRLFK